jgi:hypothetical protein
MNRLRFLYLSAALAFGLMIAGPVHAQVYSNTPGTYEASVVYIPGISVPGGLPECVDKFAQQLYVGHVTVVQDASGGYSATFTGVNQEDMQLSVTAKASFTSSWAGIKLGPLGGRSDAIIGIDAANIVSGSVKGKVTGENGKKGNLMASIGLGGIFDKCKFVGGGAK